ncbi:ANKRD65, partial [Symbiodinium necroappetens]
MTDDTHMNRDDLFETVRDGDLAEAKKALASAEMSWRHSALGQNFLFFVAARRRRGCEELAKQCIAMGINLEEVDLNGQTPLFWAAKRGNIVMVKFLLNLGFTVNFRDKARKTALFFAIENGHLDVADYLIERSASTLVRASTGKTPHAMLKEKNHKAPARKRKWAEPSPSLVCPGAETRSRFAQWEWAGTQDESEPMVGKEEENVLVEDSRYYICASVKGCSKRLRRSEREFVGDHAHIHQQETWYRELTPQKAEELVNCHVPDEEVHEKLIDELAAGARPR